LKLFLDVMDRFSWSVLTSRPGRSDEKRKLKQSFNTQAYEKLMVTLLLGTIDKRESRTRLTGGLGSTLERDVWRPQVGQAYKEAGERRGL
jgi:hypothetical protein